MIENKDKQRFCKILSKKEDRSLVDFTVEFENADKICSAGQFIHVLCGGTTFLRRPISICDTTSNTLRFIFEIRGEGTKSLSEKSEGDILDILAPLGHGFDISENDENVVLIGGGIGCFPLYNAAKKCKNATAILGFRNKDMIRGTFTDDMKKICETIILTDDGSFGEKGFTTNGLKNLIDSGKKISKILTCGPSVMMDGIIKIAQENGIECQASFEERMGCGVGTCLGCAKEINGKRVCICKEGPVIKF